MIRSLSTPAAQLALFALISSALSWGLWVADPVASEEGARQLQAALAITVGDWESVWGVVSWPCYAGLLALLVQALGISPLTAGLLTNTIAHIALGLGFAALAGSVGAGARFRWLALAVALLLPALNRHRGVDGPLVAYLACYCWSLWLFLRGRIAGWLVVALVGFLLRIEGLLWLLLPPLFAAWRRGRGAGGGRGVAVVALLTTIALLIALALVTVSGTGDRVAAADPRGWIDTWQTWRTEARYQIAALEHFATDYAAGAWLLAIVLLTAGRIIAALAPGHVLLLVAVPVLGLRLPGWWWLLASVQGLLALITTAAGSTEQAPWGLIITLLLPAPLAWERMWRGRHEPGLLRRWSFAACAVLMVLATVRALILQPEHGYLRDAGLWLAHAATDAQVYCNHPVVSLYAGRTSAGRSWREVVAGLREHGSSQYDYYALALAAPEAHRATQLLTYWPAGPVREFRNPRGDRVLVFASR